MSSPLYVITVYRSVRRGLDGDEWTWRWRMKAPNGRIVADSGQAYSSQRAALRAANAIAGTPITVDMANMPTRRAVR